MRLQRVRIALGLTGVAVSTAWAAGGPAALNNLSSLILETLPALAIIGGALILLRSITPSGALTGPLILIIVGSGAVGMQLGVVQASSISHFVPPLIALGSVLIAMINPQQPRSQTIVGRYGSLLVPNKSTVRGAAPHKLIARCFLGYLALDLTESDYPRKADDITVDVTILGGRLEIHIPENWTLRPGKMDLARGTQFVGHLNSPGSISVDSVDQDGQTNLVVLNVQGWLGMLAIYRVPSTNHAPLEEDEEGGCSSGCAPHC